MSKSANTKMKTIFQRWLVLFVVLACCFTIAISYIVQTRQARNQAKVLLKLNLDDAARQVKQTRDNLATIRSLSNNAALAKCRAFAGLVYENNEFFKNDDALERVRKDLDVDEVVVTDGPIIVGSIPKIYTTNHYDMGSQAQSAAFLPGIENPDFEIVQEPQLNGSGVGVFQYVGVGRKDKPGIIQIAYTPKRIMEAEKIADVNQIASNFRIGESGFLRILELENFGNVTFDDGQEEFIDETIDGTEYLSLRRRSGDYLLIGSLPKSEMYVSRKDIMKFTAMGYFILFAVIFLLVSMLLQKVVINGIYSVNDSLSKITEGNLQEKVEVHTAIEFDDLSTGINKTVDALKMAIDAEAKRIDEELKIGHDIQRSVLPKDYPVTDSYSLYANMYAAKEVGGDFYDFFQVDDKHLAMVMADVSGKGITAALYMMTAKTLIKELVIAHKDPAEAMRMANITLAKSKSETAFMFVTCFLAVLNTETGELVCVNGGHNPPLLKNGDANWEYQKIKHACALGVSPKAKFTAVSLQMNLGDSFIMYTDGVTEAMNSDREQFGETRLKEFLDSHDIDPKNTVEDLRTALSEYAGSYPQSDDITMLMLTLKKDVNS